MITLDQRYRAEENPNPLQEPVPAWVNPSCSTNCEPYEKHASRPHSSSSPSARQRQQPPHYALGRSQFGGQTEAARPRERQLTDRTCTSAFRPLIASRKPNWGPLIAAAIAALSLLPSTMAAPNQSTIEVDFASAFLKGPANATSFDFVGLKLDSGVGEFSWTLQADAVTANWTRQTQLELGRPPTFQDPYYQHRVGTASGAANHSFAFASGMGSSSVAELVIVDRAGTEIRGPGHEGRLMPANSTKWAIAPDVPSLGQIPYLPNGTIELSSKNGPIVLVGDFSVYLWDSSINVTDQAGTTSYRSGNWTEPIGPSSSPPAVRHRHDQVVRLDVHRGQFHLQTGQHATHWRANEIVINGFFEAQIDKATGKVAIDGTETMLDSDSITIAGDGTMRAHNASGSPPRLRATVAMSDATLTAPVSAPVSTEAQIPTQAAAAAPQASPQKPWLWLWSFLLLIPILGIVALRVEPWRPDLTDVEWAILTNRPRRARRWAGRVVRREPENPDALFLYASTLLEARRFEQVLDAVEPLAKKIPMPQRRGIAYTLAVAALRLKDKKRVQLWAREAARDPELRQRMIDDHAWRETGLCRIEDTTTYAYA